MLSLVWVKLGSRRSARTQSWLMVSILLLFLCLPLLAYLPKFHVVLPSSLSSSEVMIMETSSWLSVVYNAWALGVIVLAAFSLSRHILLRGWSYKSDEIIDADWQYSLEKAADQLNYDCSSKLSLRYKKGLLSPVVTGLFKPIILLPEVAKSWSGETRHIVLLHELGHLQRGDLWSRFMADIGCILHWYNPVVWWMRAQLVVQSEYACDEHVVRSGVKSGAYVNALCDVIESCQSCSRLPTGVAAMVSQVSLHMRAKRLQTQSRSHGVSYAVSALCFTSFVALGMNTLEKEKLDEGVFYDAQEIKLRLSADPFPGG